MKRRLRPWVKALLALSCLLGLHALSPDPPQEEVSVSGEQSESEEYVVEETEEPRTLADWKKINPKVYCVLTFEDGDRRRVIPVLSGVDEAYALKHNVHGEYDTMGSVFCDTPSGASGNLVIYGHSSFTKDWCFTFLKKFMDPEYYRRHLSFVMEAEDGTTNCRIVSAAVYDLTEEGYVGWADENLSDKTEIEAMFRETVPYLVCHTDGAVYEGGGILTLVTCDMGKEDARIVVQALREA